MASILSIARCAHRIASVPSRQAVRPLRAQWHPRNVQRQFSIAAALREKKYSEDHEWIEYSSDGKTCTMGISKYAAKQLGDVVYVELPAVDTEFAAGEAIGAVESVKSANDIMTPVSGKVLEINGTLEEKPGLVNQDPEGEAWFAKLEVQGEAESASKLMNAEKYQEFIGEDD